MGEWEGMPVSQWHRLEEHLKGTAELARSLKVRKKRLDF